jgi:hypothetical protein
MRSAFRDRKTNFSVKERTAIEERIDTGGRRTAPALVLLKRLTAAFQTCRLYGAEHARTHDAVAGLPALAVECMGPDGRLLVEITRDTWRVPPGDGEHVTGHIAPLIEALAARDVRTLALTSGVTDVELRALLGILILPIERVRAAGGAAEALRARGARDVAVQEVAGTASGAGRTSSLRRAVVSRAGAPSPSEPTGDAAALLRRFVAAAKAVRLYGEQHRITETAIDELTRAVEPALARGGALTFEVRDGRVLAADAALDDDAGTAAAFAAECAVRRIERLTFSRGATRDELEAAAAVFAREPEALLVDGGFREALRARRVTHVG